MLLTQDIESKRSKWPMIAAFTVQTGIVGLIMVMTIIGGVAMKIDRFSPVLPLTFIRPKPVPVAVVNESTASNTFSSTTPTSIQPTNVFRVPTGKADSKTGGPFYVFTDLPDDKFVNGFPGPAPTLPTTTVNVAPPPPPMEKQITRVRVGGRVQAPTLIHRVEPIYPALAKASRVGGTVRMEAVINTSGQIINLRIVSGHPLLIEAAMKAVQQWRYQPTRLNDEPVEIATAIDVNFTLSAR